MKVVSAGGAQSSDGLAAVPLYVNRQKYLAFVNTCNEKGRHRAPRRGASFRSCTRRRPRCPASSMRAMGDATVLARLMRNVHHVHPHVPMLAVAKEISLETCGSVSRRCRTVSRSIPRRCSWSRT